MHEHRIVGVRGDSLARQLAALGLMRVLAEQADPNISTWFAGRDLIVRSNVADLADWLTTTYEPTPVFSPWNGGSGFGAKDKKSKATLDVLMASADPRLRRLRQAHSVIAPLAAAAEEGNWTKERTIREIRNRCPDDLLPWIDSAVITLNAGKLAFPPLLGTGGNDGRLDFSTNFHQRLVEVLLPAMDADKPRIHALARELLTGGGGSPLTRSAIGQFDPGAAGTPNTSPFGAADSLTNPWLFILMLEGSLMFRAAPARKHSVDSERRSRAAMTFMTYGDSESATSGSAIEETRGEVWIPFWSRPLSFHDVHSVFLEGRAVWRDATATRSSDMFLATATSGVSPAVSGFDRYVVAKRNGLAFSAVYSGDVTRRQADAVEIVRAVEDWADQAGRMADRSGAIADAYRAFCRARIELARAEDPQLEVNTVRDLLGRVTDLELAVARGAHSREQLPPRRRLAPAKIIVDLIRTAPADTPWDSLGTQPEFQIATGLAAFHGRGTKGNRTLREHLLPIEPADRVAANAARRWPSWRSHAVVPGYGARQLSAVLADLVRWQTIQSDDDPSGSALAIGHTFPRGRFQPSASVVHAWVEGRLDQKVIADWLHALLALDWAGIELLAAPKPVWTLPINPLYAVLAPFRRGLAKEPDLRRDSGEQENRAGSAHDTRADGDSTDSRLGVVRYGLTAEWISQLQAGHESRALQSINTRLRQVGRIPIDTTLNVGHARTIRAIAALLVDAWPAPALDRVAPMPASDDDRPVITPAS